MNNNMFGNGGMGMLGGGGGGGGPALSLAGRLQAAQGSQGNVGFAADEFPSLTPAQQLQAAQQQAQQQAALKQQQQQQQQQQQRGGAANTLGLGQLSLGTPLNASSFAMPAMPQRLNSLSMNAPTQTGGGGGPLLPLNLGRTHGPGAVGGPSLLSSNAPSLNAASLLSSSVSPPLLNQQQQQQQQQQQLPLQQQQQTNGAAQLLPSALTGDKHGLLGLIDVLRMSGDPDTNMLSLGCELTSLGLNLNSPHPLYTTLASVYTANQPDLPLDPHFHTPQCYRLKPSTDNESSSLSLLDPAEQIAASSDDALFYAFYAFPRDRIQEAAAQELYSRGWRFHKDIKVWLTKDTPMPAPGLTNLSGASLSASPSLSESAGVAGAADGSKGTPKVGAGAGAGAQGSEKESSVSPAVAPSTTGASATTATSNNNNNNNNNTPVEFIAGERGLFVFFDPAHWQRVKKEWVVNLDVLEERNDATSRQNNGNNSRNGASVNNDER